MEKKMMTVFVNTMLRTVVLCSMFFSYLIVDVSAQQIPIDYSTFLNGSEDDNIRLMRVVNGETYLIMEVYSSDFSPITDGSMFTGNRNMVVTKFDADNNVVYSTYLGSGSHDVADMEIYEDNLYILSSESAGGDYPVTDGSTLKGFKDMVFTRMNANTGEVEFATYIGTDVSEEGVALEVTDEGVYIAGFTNNDDYPVTNEIQEYTFDVFGLDLILIKMDSSANVIYSTYVGPYYAFNFGNVDFHVENEEAIFVSPTESDDYPVTDGSTKTDFGALTVTKFDNTGNVVYSTYLLDGPSVLGTTMNSMLNDGKLSILYREISDANNQSLITDGSAYVNGSYLWTVVDANTSEIEFATYIQAYNVIQATYNDDTWLFYDNNDGVISAVKYNANYNKIIETSFPGTVVEDVHIDDRGIYLLGFSDDATLPTTDGSNLSSNTDLVFTKLDHNGNVQTLAYLGGDGRETSRALIVDNDYAYIAANKYYNAGGSSYPTTDNTSSKLEDDAVYTKIELCPEFTGPFTDTLSPSMQMVCMNGLVDQIQGTMIQIEGSSFATLYENGSPISQNALEANYQWQESENPMGPWADIPGATQKDYTPQPIVENRYFRRISMESPCCGMDTISISNVDSILVNMLTAPMVDAGGVFNTCPNVDVMLDATVTGGAAPYQYDWDMGLMDIEDQMVAVEESSVFTLLVTDANGCMQLDQALVNVHQADAGDDRAGSCVGEPVRIGGAPIAGLAGVTYAWAPNTDLSCDDCAQPNASPSTEQTYEVTLTIPVTGGGTCQTTDSIKVIPVTAPSTADFAGSDITVCLGQTGDLGTPPEYFLLDIQAVSQSSVSSGLEGTVDNIMDDNYVTGARTNLEMNPWIIFDLGQVYESVTQIEIAAINTGDLSGSSRYFQVSTDSITWENVVSEFMGVTNNSLTTYTFNPQDARYLRVYDTEVGQLNVSELRVYQTFEYIWAPGNYLTANDVSETTFQPGNLAFPNPNPILYYLTAEREGCTFVDEVLAHVIEARADVDGCGPRTVGLPDRTPNIEETYEWVKISGPGDFTGPTDQPVTTVSASVGADTEYELRVTYDGTTCTDRVIVPPACECVVRIGVDAPFACPSLGLNMGETVTLTARGATSANIDPSSYVYTWSVVSGPSGGLSSFTGSTVSLTDMQNRTFRVTLTSTENPLILCTEDIEVNNPAWVLPVYTVSDVSVCAGEPVQIGEPPVNDYAYQWTPEGSGLDQTNISNPTATVNSSTDFVVEVTDTRSGCIIRDTASVSVISVAAEAGDDILLCDNSTITLGKNPAEPGATYTWTPANASWQNGTGPNDAQPEVLVATDQEFTLEVFSPAGNCTLTDAVMVRVGTPVDPFALMDVSYCPSDGALTLGMGVPAGFASYSWRPASLFVDPTVRTPMTVDPPPSTETTVSVLVRNSTGCEAEVMQTITPLVEAPIAGNNQVICLGEETMIGSSANPIGAGISYSWSGSATADLSSTTSTNPTFTPSSAGTFDFVLTKNDNGCLITASVSVTVNSYELPAIAPITICQNTSVQIGTTPEIGVSYLWSPTTNLSDPTIANPTVSGLTSSMTYTLTATSLNGCSASADVLVGVNPISAPTIMADDLTVCFGESHVYFNPTITPAVGNYNYLWSPNDGAVEDIYDAQSRINIFSAGTKTYTLQVTDMDSGCSSSMDLNLVVARDCDFPDFSFTTPGCEEPPCHSVNSDIYLGAGVTAEASTSGDPNANSDDDDGVRFPNNIEPNGQIQIAVDIFNNTGNPSYLNAWIDWNNDGDFEDMGEQIAMETYPAGSSTEYITVMVPTDAYKNGPIGTRFRLSTDSVNIESPCGADSCAADGEVEDYLIRVECPSTICLPMEIQINRN